MHYGALTKHFIVFKENHMSTVNTCIDLRPFGNAVSCLFTSCAMYNKLPRYTNSSDTLCAVNYLYKYYNYIFTKIRKIWHLRIKNNPTIFFPRRLNNTMFPRVGASYVTYPNSNPGSSYVIYGFDDAVVRVWIPTRSGN